MSIFALKKIEIIKGRQTIEKLFIDGRCPFEEFEAKVQEDERNRKELAVLFRYIEHLANGGTLPEVKFKDITPKGGIVKEYEFRSKHLRIYAIKKDGGKIIILGGLKTTQILDIRKFKKIKKDYLKSLKDNNHEQRTTVKE